MQSRKIAFVFAGALILISLTGCVQRRFIVRSQPEGAAVTIDRQPVGRTPLSVPFTHNGTREFQLEKDGYQTIKVQERFAPTWYERFPISFLTENFWPKEIRDERLLEFQMEPKTQVQESLLLERANGLRFDIQNGTLTTPNSSLSR
ncbi:MAG: PEGA domain-containing protein [Mariniblastus sp.]